MTDGDFNTVYCQGVIARDALSGSGNTYDHINCDSGNGKSSADQAKSLCDNMKQKGITVYTIGFDIGSSAVAKDVLSYCASDASKFYQPATGSEMKAVFKTIAKSIYTLRIAH